METVISRYKQTIILTQTLNDHIFISVRSTKVKLDSYIHEPTKTSDVELKKYIK
jgi:DUF4097 and DUF4098 domain-containing protein YvlB